MKTIGFDKEVLFLQNASNREKIIRKLKLLLFVVGILFIIGIALSVYVVKYNIDVNLSNLFILMAFAVLLLSIKLLWVILLDKTCKSFEARVDVLEKELEAVKRGKYPTLNSKAANE
jgi:hypothetical protein